MRAELSGKILPEYSSELEDLRMIFIGLYAFLIIGVRADNRDMVNKIKGAMKKKEDVYTC